MQEHAIILGIKQPQDHLKNESLFHLIGKTPLHDFTDHCIGRQAHQPLCGLRIQDQVICSTKGAKQDISQSNFVPYPIWRENTRNKKDVIEKI